MSFPSERTTLSIEEQALRFEHSPLKALLDDMLRWRGTVHLNTLLKQLEKLRNDHESGVRDHLGYPVRERVHEPVG